MLAFALMAVFLIDGSPRFVYLLYALHPVPIMLLSVSVERALFCFFKRNAEIDLYGDLVNLSISMKSNRLCISRKLEKRKINK